jgi:hypothetical protein
MAVSPEVTPTQVLVLGTGTKESNDARASFTADFCTQHPSVKTVVFAGASSRVNQGPYNSVFTEARDLFRTTYPSIERTPDIDIWLDNMSRTTGGNWRNVIRRRYVRTGEAVHLVAFGGQEERAAYLGHMACGDKTPIICIGPEGSKEDPDELERKLLRLSKVALKGVEPGNFTAFSRRTKMLDAAIAMGAPVLKTFGMLNNHQSFGKA